MMEKLSFEPGTLALLDLLDTLKQVQHICLVYVKFRGGGNPNLFCSVNCHFEVWLYKAELYELYLVLYIIVVAQCAISH